MSYEGIRLDPALCATFTVILISFYDQKVPKSKKTADHRKNSSSLEQKTQEQNPSTDTDMRKSRFIQRESVRKNVKVIQPKLWASFKEDAIQTSLS